MFPALKLCAALLRAGIAVLLVVNAYWLWTGVPASAPRVPLRTALNSSISCYPNVCGCSGASRPRLTIAGFTKAWSAHSYGGLGKHADNLYRSLAERGHTVHVFTTAVRPVRAIDVEVGAQCGPLEIVCVYSDSRRAVVDSIETSGVLLDIACPLRIHFESSPARTFSPCVVVVYLLTVCQAAVWLSTTVRLVTLVTVRTNGSCCGREKRMMRWYPRWLRRPLM